MLSTEWPSSFERQDEEPVGNDPETIALLRTLHATPRERRAEMKLDAKVLHEIRTGARTEEEVAISLGLMPRRVLVRESIARLIEYKFIRGVERCAGFAMKPQLWYEPLTEER